MSINEDLRPLNNVFREGDTVSYSGDDLISRGTPGRVMVVHHDRMTVVFGDVHVIFYGRESAKAYKGVRTVAALEIIKRAPDKVELQETKMMEKEHG